MVKWESKRLTEVKFPLLISFLGCSKDNFSDKAIVLKEEAKKEKPDLKEELKVKEEISKVEKHEDHKVNKDNKIPSGKKILALNDEWMQEEEGETMEESLPSAIRVKVIDFQIDERLNRIITPEEPM